MKFIDFWKTFGQCFLMHFPEAQNGSPRVNIIMDEFGDENGKLSHQNVLRVLKYLKSCSFFRISSTHSPIDFWIP